MFPGTTRLSKAAQSGTLYVVATPIGNLEDITLRGLRVLKEADLIACEDTRHTQKLLNHYSITTRTVSYHEHNERERSAELIKRLLSGEDIALVSDAGMPGISDPGAHVISAAIEVGIRVEVVPGPVAFATALVGSGLSTDAFSFRGFLPSKAGQRRAALEKYAGSDVPVVFYEAPHRLLETLQDIREVLGPNRRVIFARELTKVHEEYVRGTATEVLEQVAKTSEVRGEIVLMIGPAETGQQKATPKQTIRQRIRELIASGAEEKDAIKAAAKEFGLGKSEAYREWQRTKK